MFPESHVFAGLVPQGYSCLYADPAWSWASWSKTRQTRAAENHYGVMSLADIKALPVADLAAPDCVLLLWAINSMLPQALDVMTAWGFTYKTVGFTWAKTTKNGKWHIGLGYHSRQNTESVLLGVRGKPRRMARDVRQLVIAPVREHSRKPDEIASAITRLYPGPYLELFARQSRTFWDSWGNERVKFDAPLLEVA